MYVLASGFWWWELFCVSLLASVFISVKCPKDASFFCFPILLWWPSMVMIIETVYFLFLCIVYMTRWPWNTLHDLFVIFLYWWLREELASSSILTRREYRTNTLYTTKEICCGSGCQDSGKSSQLWSRGRGWIPHRSFEGPISKVILVSLVVLFSMYLFKLHMLTCQKCEVMLFSMYLSAPLSMPQI